MFCLKSVQNASIGHPVETKECWDRQIPRRGLLSCMVILVEVFCEKTLHCFPQWLCQLTAPPTVHRCSSFSTALPTLPISHRFYNNRPNMWVTAHRGWASLLRTVYSAAVPIVNKYVYLFSCCWATWVPCTYWAPGHRCDWVLSWSLQAALVLLIISFAMNKTFSIMKACGAIMACALKVCATSHTNVMRLRPCFLLVSL